MICKENKKIDKLKFIDSLLDNFSLCTYNENLKVYWFTVKEYR